MAKYTPEYKAFFESPAGIQCLTSIQALVDSNHRSAEDNPELSRDCMQRAKGNREALNQINIILNEGKPNRYSKVESN